MKTLLALFVVLFCCSVEAANPTFAQFNTNQFSTQGNTISLLQGGTGTNYTVINITNTILISSNVYTTNIFTTNITAESTTFVTNIINNQFVTNQSVYQSYITNLTVNYITINSNGVGPWIYSQSGSGTNTTIYGLTAIDDFTFNTTDPLAAPLLDIASNGIVLAGFDGTQFFGNGGGLTNLQGVITSSGSTFGWIVVTNGVTNQLLSASSVVMADANKALASVANAAGVLTNNGAGVVGFNSGLRLSGDVYTASATVTNGMTNLSLSAGQFVVSDANKATASTLNGSTLTNLTYKYTTNSINTGTLSFGQEWTTNISGNITLGAFTIGDTAAYESMVIWVTNTGGSVFTVTLPNGVQSPGNGRPPFYYSTNGANNDLKILVEHVGVNRTNSSAQYYW